MHVHTSEVVISQCNSIANNEKPPPQFDETIPGRVSSFWTHQQGPSRHDQKPKNQKVIACAARVMCAKEFVID